jgi:hypothetical protein
MIASTFLMEAPMAKPAWILLILFSICVTCCKAQVVDDDLGGLVGGFYGSGGIAGSGGVFLGIYDTGSFRKLTHPGISVELGLTGPTPKAPLDGLFSLDYQSTYNLRRPLDLKSKWPMLLFLSGGYSRFFATGNAVNYGGGFIWRFPRANSEFSGVRFEYREAYMPGWGRQPGIRISYETGQSEF